MPPSAPASLSGSRHRSCLHTGTTSTACVSWKLCSLVCTLWEMSFLATLWRTGADDLRKSTKRCAAPLWLKYTSSPLSTADTPSASAWALRWMMSCSSQSSVRLCWTSCRICTRQRHVCFREAREQSSHMWFTTRNSITASCRSMARDKTSRSMLTRTFNRLECSSVQMKDASTSLNLRRPRMRFRHTASSAEDSCSHRTHVPATFR
mmetsp:Transcript_10763/g.34234  ORF Transcript_10763/g.34234 Transcript_10763/m.34234 type:complete len:207 (-) Transcript_10763:167-787(-)